MFFAGGAFALVLSPLQGVVRSFHQWRAEMQWGNKKRHLGFFERCESAFYVSGRSDGSRHDDWGRAHLRRHRLRCGDHLSHTLKLLPFSFERIRAGICWRTVHTICSFRGASHNFQGLRGRVTMCYLLAGRGWRGTLRRVLTTTT